MAAVPVGLITVPFIENVNKFQNPFRRPIASLVFIVGTFIAFGRYWSNNADYTSVNFRIFLTF